MATVFKAYHANLDRYVAIKVLHRVFKEDPNFEKRFQREAKVIAKLEHPSIVPVYDYSEHEGNSYLVMRFIEGKTLKARLGSGPLGPGEAVALVDKVGDALTYAHNRGVLHRDIKPSNIMLDDDGGVFLTDFGLARMAQAGESTLSQDTMLGTPAYMSPEQARGDRDLDARTDIYSLGVVLYEITVGRVPFSADTPYAVIHDHIFTPMPPPRSINPSVPEEVERVLLKALAKEQDDRYASANELADAFATAVKAAGPEIFASAMHTLPLTETSPVAPPPPPPTVSGTDTAMASPTDALAAKPKKRSRWLLALGGVAALVVLCLLALAVISSAEDRQEALAGFEETIGVAEEGEPFEEPEVEEFPFGEPPPPEGRCVEEGLDILPVDLAIQQTEVFPDNACAHLELAIAFGEEGHEQGALEELEVAIEQGLSVDTLFYLGDTFYDEENYIAAARLYGLVYAQHGIPDAEDIAFWTLLQAMETPEGEEAVRRLAERFPQLAFPRSALALELAYRGEFDEAVGLAVDAILTQPESPVAHFAMGLIFLEQGRPVQARLQLTCVVRDLDTPPELLADAENLLQEIGPGDFDADAPRPGDEMPAELRGCFPREGE
jgi:tetratricopeptide (TPR) repeat protein